MQWMSDVGVDTFSQEVLDRSERQPVLVDFWAEWCAPCRTLGPMLEAAIETRGGAVWLAKVNVDHNPELAARYGVRGIPVIKAFRQRQPVDELVGLVDGRTLGLFIDRICPSPEERALEQARDLLTRGQPGEVPALLEPVLQHPQKRDEALVLVARAHLVRQDFAAAERVLEQIPTASLVTEQAAQLQARLELLRAASPGPELRQTQAAASLDELDARWQLAGSLFAAGQLREAMDALLELLQRGRGYRNDGARRALLAIFDELGSTHDLVREYRRRMQVYL